MEVLYLNLIDYNKSINTIELMTGTLENPTKTEGKCKNKSFPVKIQFSLQDSVPTKILANSSNSIHNFRLHKVYIRNLLCVHPCTMLSSTKWKAPAALQGKKRETDQSKIPLIKIDDLGRNNNATTRIIQKLRQWLEVSITFELSFPICF